MSLPFEECPDCAEGSGKPTLTITKPKAAKPPPAEASPPPDEGASGGDEDVACVQCHSRGDAGRLLLCDGRGGACPIACHTYCCEPPLLTAPDGEWLCLACGAGEGGGSNGLLEKGKGKKRGGAADARPAKRTTDRAP